MGSFGKKVSQFKVKSLEEVDAVKKGVSIQLFSAVIKDTPVDTGRAKGNWQASNQKPILEALEEIKPESQVLAEMRATVLSSNLDDDVYLSNNLPYIGELEYGSSTQSPEGMVRKNIARIGAIIRKQARRQS